MSNRQSVDTSWCRRCLVLVLFLVCVFLSGPTFSNNRALNFATAGDNSIEKELEEKQHNSKTTPTEVSDPDEGSWLNPSHDMSTSEEADQRPWITMNASEFRSLLYYNLSCPVESAKFSCIHQDRPEKADASRELLVQHRQAFVDLFFNGPDFLLPENSRLVLTGDSLMRQVFISMSCLIYSFANHTVENMYVEWAKKKWTCAKTKNCVMSGPHSAFEIGSIYFRNGAEIHYSPHQGTVSEAFLEKDMYDRMESELMNDGYITLSKVKPTALPTRHSVELTDRDVLLVNVGIHYDLEEHKKRLKVLARINEMLHQPNVTVTGHNLTLWYMTTPAQHFDTITGMHTFNHTEMRSKQCINSAPRNPRLELEKKLLANETRAAFPPHMIEYESLDFGQHHIGNPRAPLPPQIKSLDCTHFCIPGPPDLAALQLLQAMSA